jgi:hypothetical protein
MAHSPKLLRLPNRGRLLVASDLHGNLRDFLAIVAKFERLDEQAPESAHLLLLGDLLHGPSLSAEQWQAAEKATPALRGRSYSDQSPAILLALSQLQERYPGRVHTLLGNHEHAHIGGPRTSLFARDETVALEQRLGVEASLWLGSFLKSLPIWALAPCGVLFSHAAPAAELGRLDELELIDYRRYILPRPKPQSQPGRSSVGGDSAARLLGQLLWTSSLTPLSAQRVLGRVGARLTVYGHAIVPAGYQVIGGQQLILSTSFGMEDDRKRLLVLDLAARYQSVGDLRAGSELLPLYP